MAASSVEICNAALQKIGAETITTLADNTRRAQLCNQQYDRVRKRLLRSHPWNFAMKRDDLTLDGTAPAFEYANRFALPSDCLRAIREEYKDVDWKVEAGYVLTNDTTFNLLYISNVTDTTKFDAIFDELLALALAVELAYPLVQSLTLKQSLEQEYLRELQDTRSFDAQEGDPEELETNDWINSRY